MLDLHATVQLPTFQTAQKMTNTGDTLLISQGQYQILPLPPSHIINLRMRFKVVTSTLSVRHSKGNSSLKL